LETQDACFGRETCITFLLRAEKKKRAVATLPRRYVL